MCELTKREYFAGLAMQGLLANNQMNGYSEDSIARMAIKQANMLLEKLDLRESFEDQRDG